MENLEVNNSSVNDNSDNNQDVSVSNTENISVEVNQPLNGSSDGNNITEIISNEETQRCSESKDLSISQDAVSGSAIVTEVLLNEINESLCGGDSDTVINNETNSDVETHNQIEEEESVSSQNETNTLISVDISPEKTPQSEKVVNNKKSSEVWVKSSRPLCANYRSDSESSSVDSESDSTYTSEDSTSSDSEDDDSSDSGAVKTSKKQSTQKVKTDLDLSDLPAIEDLKISVPEEECMEIGTITSIVDTLVVVESYKGTAALDVDTVLFLESGKRPLGKIFEVLGPVSEPIYAIRFNSQDEIKSKNIEKGLKVYCAPKTKHTSFVFLSEVMKFKGSDASWKDNVEPPPEFQDFSDDEEERRVRNSRYSRTEGEENNPDAQNNGIVKNPFNQTNQASRRILHPSRFRKREPTSHGRFDGQSPRHPPANQPRAFHPRNPYAGPPFHPPGLPYSGPPYHPGIGGPPNPHMHFTPRFSGPPFPSFTLPPYANPGQNFQQPVYQQQTHPESFGDLWRRPFVRPPPPPPPPPPPQPPL